MRCLIQLLMMLGLIVLTPFLLIAGPIGWVVFFFLLGALIQCVRVVSGRGG